jgi:hypothetical protein
MTRSCETCCRNARRVRVEGGGNGEGRSAEWDIFVIYTYIPPAIGLFGEQRKSDGVRVFRLSRRGFFIAMMRICME